MIAEIRKDFNQNQDSCGRFHVGFNLQVCDVISYLQKSFTNL
jgi:hypothetical protein